MSGPLILMIEESNDAHRNGIDSDRWGHDRVNAIRRPTAGRQGITQIEAGYMRDRYTEDELVSEEFQCLG